MCSFFKSKNDGKFGAFKGVFIPNILIMIGVIYFMRLGWILGHVGPMQMGIIITLASSLLLITCLSMTSIVSNMKIRGGGSYYLISRSLGLEFGSAIGILLCIASVVSISLCVTGFALSIQEVFPFIPLAVTEILTLLVLLLVSYISTDFALKTQVIIFFILLLSIASIFFFSNAAIDPLESSMKDPTITFWIAFAMFFPATTGIESGMALSGDLRNPEKALPLGTLASVVTIYFLYLGTAYFLSTKAPLDYLASHAFTFYHISSFKPIIMLGIWAATLSSALGVIVGTPKILQAIAKDGALPSFLGKGFGPNNEPRVALLTVFGVSCFLAVFTDFNQITPILTMSCLVAYGLINFIAFFESAMQNPSWRPFFKVPTLIPLIGSVGCFMAMFMINAGATFIVLGLVFALCFWISSKNVKGNWDDIRYSIFSYFVHKGTVKLSTLPMSAKSWRPHILTIMDSQTVNKNTTFFSHALNQEKGFLTFALTVEEDKGSLEYRLINRELKETMQGLKVPSYIHLNSNPDPIQSTQQIIQNYGFGFLRPNTVIFSLQSSSFDSDEFVQMLIHTHIQGKNIILLKDDSNSEYLFSDGSRKEKQINLWWGGKYPGNFEFSLALAYILQQSKLWPKAKICIKIIAKNEAVQKALEAQFGKYQTKLRIDQLSFQALIDTQERFFFNLMQNSADADLTLLGLKKPRLNSDVALYKSYFLKILESTQDLKNIAYVLSGEKVRFRKIFLG